MSRFLLGALTAALLFGTFSLGSSATAAESAGLPPQNTITMNFQNVDIPVLAKFISEITGRNFIIDESVRGKVTIISPSKVTPEQAYSIFQSVLQVKGFTTVQAGKIIKIVPARNVRSNAALTTSQNPAESSGDEYVTRMVRLKNIDAAAIIGVIQPMISHDGLVAAFPGDNTIIVTDDAYNVERLVQIISELDVRGEQASIVVIPLKLAFAGELAPEIDQLMGAKNAGASGSSPQMIRPQMGVATSATGPSLGYKVIPDERTNCLIVMAPPLQMREIQEIVAKLDVNPPLATSRIHVYRLKNAQALEMVQVLNNLLNGGNGPTTLSPTTGKGSLGRSSFNDAASGMGGGGFGGMGGGGGMGGMASSASFGGSMGGMSGGGGMGGTNGSGGFGGGSGVDEPRFFRQHRSSLRQLGRQEHRFLLSGEYHRRPRDQRDGNQRVAAGLANAQTDYRRPRHAARPDFRAGRHRRGFRRAPARDRSQLQRGDFAQQQHDRRRHA